MPSNPLLGTSSTIVGQDQNIPYDNEGQALAKAGEAIVDAYGTLKTRSIQNDLQEVSDEAVATAQAAQAADDKPITSDVIAQAIGGTPEQVDDPDNAVIRPVLESIARLKRANEQGAINVDEVMIRQENILREAISRHPLFAAQFIQGAQQQLGYNPIGSTIDALGRQAKQRTQPKTKADEIEEYYEKQGDLLNVDRTLKFSNPAAWYANVQKEIEFNANLQKQSRGYQLQVVTRQRTEEQALQQLRAVVMPSYGRQVVRDLLVQAQHFATMSPEQRNLAIKNGELDQFRAQIGAARVGLYNHIRTMNGNLENYLTQDNINEASRDVLAQLEYAEKSTDPVVALQGIKNHLESVVLANVDFKYPDFGTMERVTKLLANIPNDSLVAKKFSEEAASAVALGLNNMVGGIINNKDPNEVTPMSVIPPEVSPNMQPAERAKATREIGKQITQLLRTTPNDPVARRAFVRTLGAFSAEYGNLVRSTGKAPDQETSEQFVDMAASDNFRDIVMDPNVQMSDMAVLTPMNEVLAAEAMDLGVEIAQDTKNKAAPYVPIPYSGPYQYYDPSYQAAVKAAKNIPLSDVLRIQWQDGRAQVVPVEENDAAILSNGIVYSRLQKTAAEINAKYSRRLTSIVRATAHTSASDDYNNAAVIIDELFNKVRYTVPE